MSLLERLEVPEAKSRASTRPTVRPRVAASRAAPEPTTPPPTTRMSSSAPVDVAASASSARSRVSGESATDLMMCPSSSAASAHVHPVQRPLDGLLPLGVPGVALLLAPLRLPALRLVPVRPHLVGVLPEPDRQTGR